MFKEKNETNASAGVKICEKSFSTTNASKYSDYNTCDSVPRVYAQPLTWDRDFGAKGGDKISALATL